MNLDTSSWTSLTEYHLQEHWCYTKRHTGITTTDPALRTTEKTEEEEKDPNHSLDTASIIALAVIICTEATQGHSNMTGRANIKAAQDNLIQHTRDRATGPAMTHHTCHIADHLHTTACKGTALKIAVHHIYDCPANYQSIFHTRKDHTVWDHTPTNNTESHT